MSETKWQDINLEGDKVVVTGLEEEDSKEEKDENGDNEELDTELDNKSSGEDDSEDQEDEENKAEEEDEEPRKKKRRSRAQARIHQLDRQKKELEAKLNQLEQKFETFSETQSTSQLDSQIREADEQIVRSEAALAKAYEDGEFAKAAKLQRELADLSLKKAVAESTKQSRQSQSKDEFKNVKETKEEMVDPEAFMDWVEDRPWFQKPQGRAERKLVKFVREKANELSEDGYSPLEDEFYDELDEEIKTYVQENNVRVEGFEDFYKKPKRKQLKKAPVPDSGRGSAITKGKDGKTRIRLTKEEIEMANRLGVPLERYAKNKIKSERSEETPLGYTEIEV